MNENIIFILPSFMYYKSEWTVSRGCCGRDSMVVGFITTYAIGAYHN